MSVKNPAATDRLRAALSASGFYLSATASPGSVTVEPTVFGTDRVTITSDGTVPVLALEAMLRGLLEALGYEPSSLSRSTGPGLAAVGFEVAATEESPWRRPFDTDSTDRARQSAAHVRATGHALEGYFDALGVDERSGATIWGALVVTCCEPAPAV